ncbi:MAG: HlyC/CorC family transporter [Desulfovibrionaceae bacterium]|jgi:CBS domain containing-hemolysin-like protein|nr:HlyC/CorC family transporter [Desulfovibrionaceae bacterium]
MFFLLLSAGLAILISGFCSVAEAVLYSVPWTRIEQLRKEGRASGRILQELRQDIERPISAILTLNTIANTAGASIAGAAAVKVFGSAALGVFAGIFTFAILIFSEILPKTVGVAYCRTLAPALARPIRILVRVSLPVILLTSLFARAVRPKHKGPYTTEDDIRALVSMTRRHGVIEPYEEQAIKNILGMDTKTVQQIMTPRTVVFSLPASMTVAQAHALERFLHHSRFPVYGEGGSEDIIGLVFRRAILEALAQDRHGTPISDLLRPVRFVPENLTLDRLLPMFIETRTHLFAVLDEYGGLSGIVTLEDLVEEILGTEIMDETDTVEDMQEYAREQSRELAREEAWEETREQERSTGGRDNAAESARDGETNGGDDARRPPARATRADRPPTSPDE